MDMNVDICVFFFLLVDIERSTKSLNLLNSSMESSEFFFSALPMARAPASPILLPLRLENFQLEDKAYLFQGNCEKYGFNKDFSNT